MVRKMLDITHDDIYLIPGVPLADQVKLGFKPRSDASHYILQFPIGWSDNPFADENWCFQLNAWRMIDPYIREWLATEDPNYIVDSFRYVKDWYFYIKNGSASTSKHLWSDMATGIRALRLAYYLKLYKDNIFQFESNSDLMILYELIDMHAEKLLDKDKLTLTNHGLFQIFGLNLLHRVASDRPSLFQADKYVIESFNLLFNNQYTEQAVHKEHSPEYHAFVTAIIIKLGAHKFISDPLLGSKIAKAVHISKWFLFPRNRISMVGDSYKNIKISSENYDCSMPEIIQSNFPGVFINDLSDSGYVIVRKYSDGISIDSMLILNGSCYSMVHKHADDLSFELFENNCMVVVDAGKYSYNINDDRRYIISADAHSIPKIKDVTILPNTVDLYGSALNSVNLNADAIVLSGSISRKKLFSNNRELHYRPGDYLIIIDNLESVSDHNFVSELQINPDLSLLFNENSIDLMSDGSFVARILKVEEGVDLKVRSGKVTSGYSSLVENKVVFIEKNFRKSFMYWVVIFKLELEQSALEYLKKNILTDV